MAKIEIIKQTDPDGYSIGNGDEESENFAEWGEPLNATLGGKQYLAHADLDPDTGDVVSVSDFLVYEVKPIEDVDVVEDDDSDDDGDGEEAAA